ncbi:hypothetical protein GA303_04055 [Escherichia coli]|nr:hypothetical protein [Escherichia coli]
MIRYAKIIIPHGKTGKSTPEHWDKLNKLELTTFITSHVERWHQKNHLQNKSESDDSLISLQAG